MAKPTSPKSKTPARSQGAPKRAKRKTAPSEPEVLPPEELEEEESQASDESDDAIEVEPDESEISAQLPALSGSRELELPQEDSTVARSVTDPLRRYMEEVRRHPLLEPEEEIRLAVKLRDEGDLNAARTLVQANLRLVVKIAMEYRSMHTNLLDMIQEGNIGLMKAVSKFDPTKGAKLGYYASWWIRSYILKYLLDNFRLVKVGTTQAQKKLFYHLVREKERLEAQGLFAGPKLLAERLNVREKDVVEMEQRLSSRGGEVSLDAPIGDPGGALHMDLLEDDHEGADEALARDQLLAVIRDRLPEFQKQLNDKELKLLNERLLAEEPKTLQEVANQYGLTRERARQIEAKVIAKLRDFLKLES